MERPVVICGAGVIGAAVAYYLGLRGRPAILVERDGVASGASGAAAGIITPAPPGKDVITEIQSVGFEMHADLAATLPAASGVDYGYRLTPRILLAEDGAEERAFRDLAVLLRSRGQQSRWLSSAQVAERTGWVDRAGRGGVEVQAPAQLDPYRFTLALVAAAERMGAVVRSGSLSGIRTDAGRVTGAVIGGAVIETDAVVIAAGPWSAVAGDWAGTPIPVEPLKGQIVKVRPARPLRNFCVGQGGDYAITKEDGIVYLGTTEETVGFDVATTEEARDAILRFGVGFASALESAELIEQTACLRPLSGDGLPIIGSVARPAGVYVATGHGRQGILMSPPTGKAIADLIMDGRADGLDLGPFDPQRFEH